MVVVVVGVYSILAEVIHPLCWTSSSVSIHWKHTGPVEWNWACPVLSWQGNEREREREHCSIEGAGSGGLGGGPRGRLRRGEKGCSGPWEKHNPWPLYSTCSTPLHPQTHPVCATCHWPLQPPSHSPQTFEPVSLPGLQMCVSLHPPKPTTTTTATDTPFLLLLPRPVDLHTLRPLPLSVMPRDGEAWWGRGCARTPVSSPSEEWTKRITQRIPFLCVCTKGKQSGAGKGKTRKNNVSVSVCGYYTHARAYV